MADCLAPRVRNRTKKLTTLVYVFFNSFGVYTLLFKYKVKFGLTLLALCAKTFSAIYSYLTLYPKKSKLIHQGQSGIHQSRLKGGGVQRAITRARDETQSRLSADFGDVQPYVRFIYRCVCVFKYR